MRVLLTGATGFIGAAVLARLRMEGHEVVGVTRGRGPATPRVPADELDVARASRADSATFAAVPAIFWLMIARPQVSLFG
jgi:nucleoside-diphosphate-sugar epimerase